MQSHGPGCALPYELWRVVGRGEEADQRFRDGSGAVKVATACCVEPLLTEAALAGGDHLVCGPDGNLIRIQCRAANDPGGGDLVADLDRLGREVLATASVN